MEDHFPQFLLMLVVILGAARLFGELARLMGQPAVLGELLAGVIIGPSVLFHLLGVGYHGGPLVDPSNETLHLLAELGVVILLFEIGLETDIAKLLAVGPTSLVVALVGVAAPFAFGYGICLMLGYDMEVSVVVGATLTATSVGITARVLAELGRLQDPESRVILGAAVLDDIIGLVILAVLSASLNGGEEVTTAGVLLIVGKAFGFLAGALIIGLLALPLLRRAVSLVEETGIVPICALLFALGMAYLADFVQPRLTIVGAFAAGLVLAKLPQIHLIERGIAPIGHFFVPIFFVVTGAAVDVNKLNPLVAENRPILEVGGLLLIAAFVGKFISGYAPFWFKGKKSVIGVGMVPRGEVGLIFANAGRRVVGDAMYSALALLIMVTTLIVPPLLKLLLGTRPGMPEPAEPEGVQELTNEP